MAKQDVDNNRLGSYPVEIETQDDGSIRQVVTAILRANGVDVSTTSGLPVTGSVTVASNVASDEGLAVVNQESQLLQLQILNELKKINLHLSLLTDVHIRDGDVGE